MRDYNTTGSPILWKSVAHVIWGGPQILIMREDVDASKCYIIFSAVIYARKIVKPVNKVKSNRLIPKYVIKTLKSTMTDRTPGS